MGPLPTLVEPKNRRKRQASLKKIEKCTRSVIAQIRQPIPTRDAGKTKAHICTAFPVIVTHSSEQAEKKKSGENHPHHKTTSVRQKEKPSINFYHAAA